MMFWGQFGAALKEGLYDAPQHRTDLFKVCRFASTNDDGGKMTSLADYVERMPEEQKDIYYISGESVDHVRNSPQIEGFKSRGIEVLCLTDTIDDFWLQQVSDFDGHAFKSVTQGDIDLDNLEKDNATNDNDDDAKSDDTNAVFAALINDMQERLKDDVQAVRVSKRLTESPVCLVAPADGVDMHMERVLKVHQQYEGETKPILEINEDHVLIKMMAEKIENGSDIETETLLLLDQARIIQGEPIKDPAGFARRMSKMMIG